MALATLNPSTGELIKEFTPHSDFQIREILSSTALAQEQWSELGIFRRCQILQIASRILLESEEQLAALMTLEMGKPMKEARAEIKKCAWVCDYYAQNSEKFLEPRHISAEVKKSYVSHEPLGVILAIMPWNFPFWQVFRAAAPALMAGNGMILKHASNVPQCAVAIEKIFMDAGFPGGIFQSVLVGSDKVSAMIESPEIQGITLTGSTPAGREVASLGGKNLKKTLLELGGSDPYLILKDADLEMAADHCIRARLLNNGQSCISPKRLIAVTHIHKKFEKILIEKLKNKKFGDPSREDTELGPMARLDLRDELHIQVKVSIEKGADCLLGGKIPEQKGAWYPPTLLSNVKKGMPAFDEELFGPVVVLIEAKDEQDAINLANDTPFGLGAAVFSRDEKRAEEIACKKLNAGLCFVNSAVKSDPRLPFGGVKDSGYGRELSLYGIHEFVNLKTVSVSY